MLAPLGLGAVRCSLLLPTVAASLERQLLTASPALCRRHESAADTSHSTSCMSTAALPTHLHLDNCAATCSHGMWSTGAVKKWRFNNALREVDRKGSNAKKWVRGVLKEWLDVLVCGSGEYTERVCGMVGTATRLCGRVARYARSMWRCRQVPVVGGLGRKVPLHCGTMHLVRRTVGQANGPITQQGCAKECTK